MATLLEHVNNKFCKVNFKNLILFFFALIFSCKLENNDGGSKIKCQATRWGITVATRLLLVKCCDNKMVKSPLAGSSTH